MSIIGILSSSLFSAGAAQTTPSSQGNPSAFQQIKTEFQQLGQDLQSGNLSQAQSDFTTLSQNLSSASQSSATGANPASGGTTTIAQVFSQLGQDLQSGNLQGAQQDFTNFQQNLQQATSQQVGGHHGHHHHSGKLVGLFLPADESNRSGFRYRGAGFAGGKSFWRSVGLFCIAERSSANRRFPSGGIERRLQHGGAGGYR